MSGAEDDADDRNLLDLVAQRRSRFRRILMAFDPASVDRAAAEATARLAARLEAELTTLIVEDENVLHAVQYAGAGVFSTLSDSRRVVDVVSVERALRVQTSRSRRVVEQVVSGQRVKVTFEVRRGRVATEVLACAAGSDLIVLGRGRQARRSAPMGHVARAVLGAGDRSVLLLCPGAQIEGPVLTFYDGSPAAEAALLAAADVADNDGGRVLVALIGEVADSGKIDAWHRSIARRLASRGLQSEFVRIDADDRDGIRDLTRRWGVSVAVLSGGQLFIEGERLQHLLDVMECSVLLLR